MIVFISWGIELVIYGFCSGFGNSIWDYIISNITNIHLLLKKSKVLYKILVYTASPMKSRKRLLFK